MLLARLVGFLASIGRNFRLLEAQGFVMTYTKTDGDRKFSKCLEDTGGYEVRVSVQWEKDTSVRHNRRQHN